MFSSRGEMMRYGYLTIGLAALALSGCASVVHQEANEVDPNYGRALRQNLAAQVADPAPNYNYTEPPASDGPRTALAQERYQTGTVIEPTVEPTQTISSGGGGGGSGGGGGGN